LIVKLGGVKNAIMNNLVYNLKEKVKDKFLLKINQLKEENLSIHLGLSNKEFKTIKVALNFVPEDIASEIETAIEDFVENYEKLQANYILEIKEDINNNEVDEIKSKLNDLKKAGRWEDLKITEKTIIE